MPVQKFFLSSNIQERRGIVYFPKQVRIGWIAPVQQTTTGLLDLRKLLGGCAEWLARMDRLGYLSRQVLGLKRRERSIEDRLGAPKFAQELSRHACAQARGQRQRQPSQVLVGLHQPSFELARA
ncbi:MAG: hypothetical protein WBC04_17135 [Candidatus Acidiferrales bacterium]